MLIIGLTGGIGSGKSAVSKLFSELGAPIIDTDIISRQVVEPGQPALQQICTAFGDEILTASGELDRSKLRDIVFASPKKRAQLEAILHPLIQQEMLHQASLLNTPYCIFAIPLLIEANQTGLVDRTLVIDAPEELRRQRIKQRDHLDDNQIDAIFTAQLPPQERLKHADDIIHNNSGLDHLRTQVIDLNRRYTEISKLEKCLGKLSTSSQ